MQRIFSRKRKDYRLFAAALAFGFSAVLATVVLSYSKGSQGPNMGSVQHAAMNSATNTDTIAFAYASQAANAIFQPITPAQAATAPAASLLKPFQKKSLSMTEVVSVGKGDTLNKIFEAFEVPTEISLEAVK